MSSTRQQIDPSRLREIAVDANQLEALRQQMRVKCRKDLWFFAYHCCGYKDIDTELHHIMCETWVKRSGLRNTLWMVPRGHLKTTLWTVAGLLWELLRDPDLQIQLASGDDEKSEGMLADIRRVIE